MVTREQEPQLSPPSYGRDNPKAPPSPKVAPSRGQATYDRGNPKTPSSPEYGGDNLNVSPPAESRGQNGYGRDKTKAPPLPEKAPSDGQKTYGGGNRKTLSLPEVDGGNKADLNSPTRYGRVDPRTPPSPDPSDPRIQSVDGRVDPAIPTPPEPAEPTRPMLGGPLRVVPSTSSSCLSPDSKHYFALNLLLDSLCASSCALNCGVIFIPQGFAFITE
ncbi:hypothetical protein L6452_17304 [Arctium lappa]|uniref:Uncharacterized protein n=1 Tax=Arctium lappa TaxID=4217 RepID=A0ACB9C337_ARCLA|nr:hypothetical protein L6452_17304 [Arctium lappa]